MQILEARLDEVAPRIEANVDDRSERFMPRELNRYGDGYSRAV